MYGLQISYHVFCYQNVTTMLTQIAAAAANVCLQPRPLFLISSKIKLIEFHIVAIEILLSIALSTRKEINKSEILF